MVKATTTTKYAFWADKVNSDAKAKKYLLEDTTEAEQFPIMHRGPLHGRENQNNSEV